METLNQKYSQVLKSNGVNPLIVMGEKRKEERERERETERERVVVEFIHSFSFPAFFLCCAQD
jgi:hypothetical protein